MILLRIRLCRNTHTRRTSRFCMYLSCASCSVSARSSTAAARRALMFSHDEMQLEMYRCTNSIGSSTAVVSRLTTSMECKLMSMLTSTEKYSLIWLDACGVPAAQATWRARNASIANAHHELQQRLDSNVRVVLHQLLYRQQHCRKARPPQRCTGRSVRTGSRRGVSPQ